MGELPYKEIPDYPDRYSPGNVISRLIDGLGYRYYWATEGLSTSDLLFKPSEDARSTRETLEHISSLSELILNTPQGIPNIGRGDLSTLSFDALRSQTLANLQQASSLMAGKDEDEIADHTIVFQRPGKKIEWPFWNLINGPLSDAIYHTGQVVSFRRSSGNPINSGVRVFLGKTVDSES